MLIHIRTYGTFYKLETVMLTLICLISTLEFKHIKIMISQNKKTEYNDFNFYNIIVWLLRDISSNKDNDTHVLTSEIEKFDSSFQASQIIMKNSVQNQL